MTEHTGTRAHQTHDLQLHDAHRSSNTVAPLDLILAIAKHSDSQKGFVALPKRRIVDLFLTLTGAESAATLGVRSTIQHSVPHSGTLSL